MKPTISVYLISPSTKTENTEIIDTTREHSQLFILFVVFSPYNPHINIGYPISDLHMTLKVFKR